ncbi:MAG: S-layer homology domain-containing protein [Oscillibacter sp.]
MKKRLQKSISCLLLCALLTASWPAAQAARFTDVPKGNWAASAIERCVSLGFFQGESKTVFGVGRPMTRAAFVVALGRFFAWPSVTPPQGSFTDNQNKSAWYYSAVETAYANDAITHQSADFRPNDPLTREELAVMLVRALGYGTIAGLAQELPLPFTDVTSSRGYISMAYELGILSGTSKTTFSPNRPATREQAAVVLMRVYDRTACKAPGKIGIAASPKGLTDLTGFSAVGIAAAKLNYNGKAVLAPALPEKDAAALRSAASAAGAKALLYVTGGPSVLKGAPAETAALLAGAVASGGYDGLFLDLPRLPEAQKSALTDLTCALRTALEKKPLYLMAEAPVWQGTPYHGYDYAALSQQVDRLVLRVAPYEKIIDDFPAAPPEPPEELYYALGELHGAVPGDKLSLLLTTTGSAWSGTQKTGSVSAAQLSELAASPSAETYVSARYACAYLTRGSGSSRMSLWFLDGDAAAQRIRLAGFFGVNQVCLSDLTSVSAAFSAGLQ